jgi:hypothetical protein
LPSTKGKGRGKGKSNTKWEFLQARSGFLGGFTWNIVGMVV